MQPRPTYRCDLSDDRWALIEPFLTAWRARNAGRCAATYGRTITNIYIE